MKTFIVTLLTLVVAGAMLIPEPADAKRFGGGKSFGRQYSQPAKPAQPPAAQQTPRQQQAAPGAAGQRPSGASRWLGPLAGLAAGGLLASLFFGDAFEGFQIMDFLLIALLIFGGVMLFKMLRQRGAGGARPAHAGAGAGPLPHGGVGYGRTDVGGPYGGGASGLGGISGAAQETAGQGDAPTWFDAAGFVEGAKTHFIRLQAAWDRSDFADIRDYTSPQMYAELKREREALGDAPNDTEVVRIDAELLGVQRDGDQVVASVRFNGLIREETSGTANPMDEVWHVAHGWDSPEGDWIIVGIQQAGE